MPKNEAYTPMNQIIEPDAQTHVGGLWLGDYSAALNKKSLESKNIRTVLTAATGLKLSYDSNINHKVLHLYDCESQRIERYFKESYHFIEEGLKKGNVFVHCFAGISRSATIVMAYLMRSRHWTMKEAFDYAKKRRKYVDPNKGFRRALRRFEKELQAEWNQKQNDPPNNEPENLGTSAVRQSNHQMQKELKRSRILFRNHSASNIGNRGKEASPQRAFAIRQLSRANVMRDLQNIYLGLTASKKKIGLARSRIHDIPKSPYFF